MAGVATAGAIASGAGGAGGASAGGGMSSGFGGPSPEQALSDAVSLFEALQLFVLLGSMAAVPPEVAQFAETLKWSTLQISPPWEGTSGSETSSEDSEDTETSLVATAADFEGCLFWVFLLVLLIGIHGTVSKHVALPLALSFPTAELYIVKIVFGALCVASALVSSHSR